MRRAASARLQRAVVSPTTKSRNPGKLKLVNDVVMLIGNSEGHWAAIDVLPAEITAAVRDRARKAWSN